MPPITKEVAEYKAPVMDVQRAANEYIVTADSIVGGEQLLRDIRSVELKIEERKTDITRPLMSALASARDLFKPLEIGLADAKKTVKEKILAYTVEQEEKARIESERIAKRVEKGTMKADTAAGKLATIESGKAITTDILREGKVIPGVEKYEEKTLVIK